MSLLAEGEACIVDSYETRVLCGPPDGASWRTLNRGVGEGPTELRSILSLLRVDSTTVAVYDYRNGRISVFESVGDGVRSNPVPRFGAPFAAPWNGAFTFLPMQRTLLGEEEVLELTWVELPDTDSSLGTLNRSIGEEGPVRLRPDHLGPIPDGAPVLGHGLAVVPTSPLRLQSGDVWMYALDGILLRFDSTGRNPRLVPLPNRPAELLSERDIQDRRSTFRTVFDQEMPRDRERSLRSTVRSPVMGDQALRSDSQDRVWIATSRDREGFSYFEVLDGAVFLNPVRVRDRILGYDLLDSLLAVVVEGAETDSAGLHPRYLDLYRILSPDPTAEDSAKR